MQQLENIKTWHCFFEQSGTFKNQFKRLGLNAYDYDILDDFGETDYKKDLFAEIAAAYQGGASIFDKIEEGEAIMAFFPCIRFSKLFVLHLQGTAKQYKGASQEQKGENFIKFENEKLKYCELITKLVLICLRRNIPLIIENPYGEDHYLTRYWPYLPAVVDTDRRRNGDYYEKPTQFWFFNCEPLNNLIMDEPIAYYPKRRVIEQKKVEKSMISPAYARRFIRSYLKLFDENDCLR